jgi:hypothetical protein
MQQQPVAPGARRDDDVRFIGALTGCYALSERRTEINEPLPVYACRLCSISPFQAVIVAPVAAQEGETVAAHFRDFGLLRATVARETPTGFVLDFDLDRDARSRLAAKIRWKKNNAHAQVVDKREFPRILPRMPRTVLTLADGQQMPCFVIDISQSGAAISCAVLPGKGTPLALGSLVGRVVRKLDVGFAIEFAAVQPLDQLELRMAPPAASG